MTGMSIPLRTGDGIRPHKRHTQAEHDLARAANLAAPMLCGPAVTERFDQLAAHNSAAARDEEPVTGMDAYETYPEVADGS